MARAIASDSNTRQTPAPKGRGSVAYWLVQRAMQQRELTVVLVTLFVIIYFSIANSAFYTTANIITVAQYIASIAVIGFGEVLILVLGEIDLSAGAVYLSSPWFMYFFWTSGMPIGWAIVAAVACCAGIGMVNPVLASTSISVVSPPRTKEATPASSAKRRSNAAATSSLKPPAPPTSSSLRVWQKTSAASPAPGSPASGPCPRSAPAPSRPP